ncbi:hypothetical protein HO173_011531 [Letharia columbiana]|uniref:Uncharacterized protein n=1 Tax=Letharia columbiana TaxID=112416 RepID=A0A8H6FJ56_9LECA|nr:uncharacterized protein HO173_011531 [Letharia columbiana]KAF6229491.1 hypothetical protein HO173_011531 [Letharia columbiana]
MADYEVMGKNKQGRKIYSDINPSFPIHDSRESEGDYCESPDLLSKQRLIGPIPKGRKHTIFAPWTFVSIVIICAVTAYALFVLNLRHQDQRWRMQSSAGTDTSIFNFGPSPPKSGLNFPQEYPKLDIDHSTLDCRNAWHRLVSVPCHEQIWTRSWDYGNYDFREPDLNRFLPLICKEDCTAALNEAQNRISNSCSAQDHFKLRDYVGRFDTTLLEPNPVAVMDMLVARQTHDCRTSPIGDAEREYCMTDLQERWSILDGLMVEPLHGIDEFLLETNRYRIESGKRMAGVFGGRDWLDEYNYMREERRFGPGRGETLCSYCTLDWLGRKMKSWKPDLIYDEDGLPMELPVYVARISKAGRRCAGENFTMMWADAVDHYEEQGLLDREGQWLRKPSRNRLYLFQHGPSAGDTPLPEIRDYLEEMGDWQSSHPYLSDNEGDELDNHTSCLQGLHEEILSMTCYPFLSIEDLVSNILDNPEHFRSSCTSHCQASIQRLRFMTFEACPELLADQKRVRTLKGGNPFSLYEWRELIFSDTGSLALAENACVRVALKTLLAAVATNVLIWDLMYNPEELN